MAKFLSFVDTLKLQENRKETYQKLQSNNLEIPPIVKVKTLQFFLPETTSKL
jgi:hypothetical protein